MSNLQELGPNLEDLLQLCGGKFSLKTCLTIALQILDRLELLHAHGFVYRDVKPENFLIGDSKGNEHFLKIILKDSTFYFNYIRASLKHDIHGGLWIGCSIH